MRKLAHHDRRRPQVLALLWLGLHDNSRAWKGFDWDAMNRLHEKGYISHFKPALSRQAPLA